MRFGILGETLAYGPDGRPLALGGPRRRAVLALLLLDAGRFVPVDRLVDALYGEQPPAGVANAVQSQVSRLRAVLGDVIERHPAGYRLAVDPAEVDVHRFARLAAEGRRALAAEEPARAARVLAEALALWRGPALADVREAPFAAAQVTRLTEARAGALENRMAAGLALGDHAALVPELRELVAEFPLRERPLAQLMRALAGSGRQVEALEVYDSARRELAETLGADPGPELSGAQLAVLRGDVSRETSTPVPGGSTAGVSRETSLTRTSGPVSRETSSVRSAVSRETALPAQLTSFVGRAPELARIAERLTVARLVTLTGPGGAGKTRLSIEAAARHADDVCFVPLAGVTDGDDVPQAVLGALGLREVGLMPSAGPVQEPLDRMVAALSHRSMLLVLDNCEHVIDAAAALAAGLLAGCPSLRVLATSRAALGITGETLCPVPMLSVPPPEAGDARLEDFPAVRLFVERAVAVRPDFTLVAERDAVLRICAALDGLPLAIELAAARLRSLSAAEIADRLGAAAAEGIGAGGRAGGDQRFRLLSRGSRAAQPRQRTLRGVVDWSWDLLTPSERAVLRRVSVFAGGWTPDAAEAVCADGRETDGEGIAPEDVLDLIDSLVDKSLVVADRTRHGSSRYRMLETIRAYGAERLEEAGESARVRRGHLAHFLDLAIAAEPRLRRAEQLDWLARLSAEHDNLTAALHRAVSDGDHPSALRMLACLTTYWMLRGIRYEGAGPARRLLDAVGTTPPADLADEYAMCVINAAPAAHGAQELAGHLDSAQRIIERGLVRYPVLWLLWAVIAGVPDNATYASYRRAIDLVEGDAWFEGLRQVGEGYQNWLVLGRAAEADRAFTASLKQFRAIGDRWGTTLALTHLAGFVLATGELTRAVALVDEALVLADEMGATENRAELSCHRGQCGLLTGDLDAARTDYTRAVELARASGAPEFQAVGHLGLAECARLGGDPAAARELAMTAMSQCLPQWFTGEGTRGEAMLALGRISLAEGDPAGALERFRASLASPMNARSRVFTAAVAEALADLALHRADPARAAELLGLARALRGMDVREGPDADRVRAAARTALGGTRFGTAHARGAALGADAAVEALRVALGED
ncbi:AfsR/SARP family transcriptional regulator [Streptantibioticus silvisoli]|uniref:BTAD domain-containing putative transcriptional regulator n=1 Tax=Streptantibioticus silvisoli TaxID=2705255 RepID=A0ABT6W0Q9_9ACTN|nr:BTAD domain-containing putative transcriptional regulator [Streptantibioticus silvisoli]MDI5964325.1 BTAD domain-containing putative transcriptional regulator [Streptantibioticus silvisoli]